MNNTMASEKQITDEPKANRIKQMMLGWNKINSSVINVKTNQNLIKDYFQ